MNDQIRQDLETKRRELESRVQKLAKNAHTPLAADWEDRAIELENEEVQQQLGDEGVLELQNIYNALKRMDTGTFGKCKSCKQQISPARLKALPYAEICMDCAD